MVAPFAAQFMPERRAAMASRMGRLVLGDADDRAIQG
jgi:hypothetical protein